MTQDPISVMSNVLDAFWIGCWYTTESADSCDHTYKISNTASKRGTGASLHSTINTCMISAVMIIQACFLISKETIYSMLTILQIYNNKMSTCTQFTNPELSLVDVPYTQVWQAERPVTFAYLPSVQDEHALAP